MANNEYQLIPAFTFDSNESDVLHHNISASVCINGNTYPGTSEVRLDLLPQAAIRFYGSFNNIPFIKRVDQNVNISFLINGSEVKGFSVRGGDPEVGELSIKLYPESEPIAGVGDGTIQMTRIIFHLFNFVEFMGSRRSSEPDGKVIEHIDLLCDEWKIELKSLSSTQKNIKLLNENGGYRLTHIGSIQKSDDSSFIEKDINECLTALRYFLSFVKGGWCNPICPVGFDETGHRVWEQRSSPREAWHRPFSWFDTHSTEQLPVLFKGFMKI